MVRRLWWRIVDKWRWHVHGTYDLELTYSQARELDRRGLIDDVRVGAERVPDDVAAMFDPDEDAMLLECLRPAA